MTSVGEDWPKERSRLARLIDIYREIGPAGAFAAAMAQDCLSRADEAWASQDVVAIVRSYQEMQEFKE